MKDQLRQGLASLPRPKNDYEIVVPEDMDQGVDDTQDTDMYIEDQADVDDRSDADKLAKRKTPLYLLFSLSWAQFCRHCVVFCSWDLYLWNNYHSEG